MYEELSNAAELEAIGNADVEVAEPQEESAAEFNEDNSEISEVAPTPVTEPPGKIETVTPKQTKEENSKFASQRRQAELDRVKSEASKQAILDSIKGMKNTFTNEPLEDADDLADFKAMQKLEAEGKDPIADFAKFKRDQRKLEAKAQVELEEKQSIIDRASQELQDSITEVNEKYNANIEEMYATDTDFRAFADECAQGEVPFKSMVKLYFQNKNSLQQRAETRARDLSYKSKATPGSLSGEVANTAISPDEYMKLALAGKLD